MFDNSGVILVAGDQPGDGALEPREAIEKRRAIANEADGIARSSRKQAFGMTRQLDHIQFFYGARRQRAGWIRIAVLVKNNGMHGEMPRQICQE